MNSKPRFLKLWEANSPAYSWRKSKDWLKEREGTLKAIRMIHEDLWDDGEEDLHHHINRTLAWLYARLDRANEWIEENSLGICPGCSTRYFWDQYPGKSISFCQNCGNVTVCCCVCTQYQLRHWRGSDRED